MGRLLEQRWVFGGVERRTNKGFLQLVQDRTAGTLLNIIQNRIAPGSIIHSDGFASYNNNIVNIPVNPPYRHLTVIHDQNFVDPVSGACTNRVECYWKSAKRRFKAMLGVHNSMPPHLDEFMWREIHGKDPTSSFNNFIDHLSQWYPAP